MDKKKFFGTDGIRGKANFGNMTAEVAMKLGMAAGSLFTRGSHRHRVIIGKDTRLSGYLLEPALTSGFISVGMDVFLVGPMPTPAIAMLTRSLRADLGVMISASHNSYEDNGIKLFGPDGRKLSDETELEIERRMLNFDPSFLASPNLLGRAKRLDDAPGRYVEFVKNTFPKKRNLDGFKIVVDAANGAAYHIANNIFWELGADVISIGISPDGFNINQACGSTDIKLLQSKVLEHGADIGIALDGDADRIIIIDEKGNPIDGDQIIAIIASYYKEKQWLNSEFIVSTIMSNLGLEKYLNGHDLKLHRTKVGDRYVAESMFALGANIGGEPSGHIILSDYNTTGDSLIAALQILSILVEKDKKTSELCKAFDPFPQILKNVKITSDNVLNDPEIKNSIAKAESHLLNNNGRLVIRKSGTEPLIRIMAEAENQDIISEIVENIAMQIESRQS